MAVKKKKTRTTTNPTTNTYESMEDDFIKDSCMEDDNYEEIAEFSGIPDTKTAFFESIKNAPVLSKEETMTLFARIAKGDEKAKNMMIYANLKLVANVANDFFVPDCMEYMDLVMAGTIGLINAIDRFDASLGYCFSTMAVYWIRKAIYEEIAENGRTIRLPKNVLHEISLIKHSEEALEEHLEKNPTEDEIAADTGLSVKKLRDINICKMVPGSIDSPVKEDEEDGCQGDFIPCRGKSPEELIVNKELRDALENSIGKLHPLQVEIVRLYTGFNEDGIEYTVPEIAKKCGMSSRRAQGLLDNAFLKIRNHPESVNTLKDYLSDAQRDRLGLAA